MDKRVWEQPMTMVQKFEANEYVAACGDSGVTYYFKCDASGWFGDGGIVWNDTNKDGQFDFGKDEFRSFIHHVRKLIQLKVMMISQLGF